MSKIHMCETLVNVSDRKVRTLKNAKCGVRNTGMGVSGVKCGDVRPLGRFNKAMSLYPGACCEKCVDHFEAIKRQFRSQKGAG